METTQTAPTPPAAPDKMDQLLDLTAQEFGIPAHSILGNRRPADLVEARQAAMWLCRVVTRQSLPAIGMKFKKKHHGTVMHALRVIWGRIDTEPDFQTRLHHLYLRACGYTSTQAKPMASLPRR